MEVGGAHRKQHCEEGAAAAASRETKSVRNSPSHRAAFLLGEERSAKPQRHPRALMGRTSQRQRLVQFRRQLEGRKVHVAVFMTQNQFC